MSEIVYLTLPYPPQANHMFTVARGRKIVSSKYRLWRDLAASLLIGQRFKPISGPFLITLSFDRPDRRRRDLDNLAKPILDAITKAGIIGDDSDAEVITLRWGGREPVRQTPECRVVICPVE